MFTKDQISGKKVLIRADLDVDLQVGAGSDIFRLKKLLPSLNMCLEYASQVCLIGHRGRPDGKPNSSLSLKQTAETIKRLINQEIKFIDSGFPPGEWWKGGEKILLLENLRFDKREESLDESFARELSTGADVYIYESFATYRPCTSLTLLPKQIPTYTGFQFDLEVETLKQVLVNPNRPTLLVGSGAKADKKTLLNQIATKFDSHFWGGVFADKADLTDDGLDLNAEALTKLDNLIDQSQTIVINGLVGKYEDDTHSNGSKHVFQKLLSASSSKKVVLGGGDTIAALQKLGFEYTRYGFVSTGGGGMLEFLLTGTHPLLAVLK